MKKFIIVLVFVVSLTITLMGCGKSVSSSMVSVDALMSGTTVREDLTSVLPELKQTIREVLTDYDFLNWEQFEKVVEVREIKNPNLAETFARDTGFYVPGLEIIVVSPQFFDKGGGEKMYVLAHEVIHSLMYYRENIEEDENRLFNEGITDYLATIVLNALYGDSIEYGVNYKNEIYCLSWLMELYGSEAIVKEVCAGTLVEFVDEKAGEGGIGNQLHESLTIIDYSKDYEEVKDAILAEMDILIKLSSSNNEVREKFTKLFEQGYASYLK